MIRLTWAVFKYILHTVLSVIYLLVFGAPLDTQDPSSSSSSSSSGPSNTPRAYAEEPQLSRVANDDVVEAMDLEIEALRNYRDQLREQARGPKCDAIKRAKLEKQAAALNTRMMKINEQVLKRRY